MLCRHDAKASQPRINAISLTKALASLALVCLERNCDSFARRQGCLETCKFAGSGDEDMMDDREEKPYFRVGLL